MEDSLCQAKYDPTYGLINNPRVGCQQDLRLLDFTCRVFGAIEQCRKLLALLVTQIDAVSYIHR
jgi:hypothetical protein